MVTVVGSCCTRRGGVGAEAPGLCPVTLAELDAPWVAAVFASAHPVTRTQSAMTNAMTRMPSVRFRS